jgi:PAS domain S-box-containing protein
MSYSFVATPAILSKRGNMVQEIRARQWDKTPLGKQDDWPTVLKMAVGLILQSPVAMVTLWGDDGIMLYNDAYVVFAGGHHPQLLGLPVREGWSEVADFADEVMQRVMRGETLSFRQRELTLHRYGHPEQVWLDLDFSPITDLDDVVVGVLGIVVETTEKYQANKILTLDRERLKTMFDQAPGFMALLSGPKHVYEMVNHAYLALVGQRDVLGKTVAVAIPETVEQGFITILDQVYQSGVAFSSTAAPIMLDDAQGQPRQRYIDLVYQPLRNETGAVFGIFVEGSDVTESIRTFQALQTSESELKAESHRKDEFLAMLAHELRNPLAPIASAAEMLRIVAHGDAKVLRAAEVIARQAKHLSVLVDDLLDVSRVNRGLVDLKMDVVDLDAIVESAVEQARPLLQSKKHSLTVSHEPGHPYVTGDRNRLVQVIVNLLNNAAKYTPDGGSIVLALHNDGSRVFVDIQDNGIGIDTSVLPSIFDLFTQASRTPDRSQGGLGIGLALVKTIVSLHGGEVTASSGGLGAGSKFTVILPCTPNSPA